MTIIVKLLLAQHKNLRKKMNSSSKPESLPVKVCISLPDNKSHTFIDIKEPDTMYLPSGDMATVNTP